jgi:hypothetical protein
MKERSRYTNNATDNDSYIVKVVNTSSRKSVKPEIKMNSLFKSLIVNCGVTTIEGSSYYFFVA